MISAITRSWSFSAWAIASAEFMPWFFQALMVHCHWRAVAMSGLPPQSFRMPVTSSASRMLHFGRGLVGEGDGRDALRGHARLDQARDLHRDHPRLARAGACQHQAGALEVVHGFKLGEIQTSRHGEMGGACDRLMSGGVASGARNDTGTGRRTLVGSVAARGGRGGGLSP